LELEWGRAAFTTWTQTAAGLTRNDFILAAKIDQLAGTCFERRKRRFLSKAAVKCPHAADPGDPPCSQRRMP
jgi:Pterin 4 alpha carbinolamine dehydratase